MMKRILIALMMLVSSVSFSQTRMDNLKKVIIPTVAVCAASNLPGAEAGPVVGGFVAVEGTVIAGCLFVGGILSGAGAVAGAAAAYATLQETAVAAAVATALPTT
jgi:hypothetical protein